MERVFIVDVSRYQRPELLDYALMRAGGVRMVIAKSSQGAYSKDPCFDEHIRRARLAGLDAGAYHWVDPVYSAEANLANFERSIAGAPLEALALDHEQYWADWAEWRLAIQGKGKITKILPAGVISACGERMARAISKGDFGRSYRLLNYTRQSFVRSWARPMVKWLKEYDLWPAHYPYSRAKVETTWEELAGRWFPRVKPLLPDGCKDWRIWQISGDKFILPGSARKVLDVNVFNGDAAQYAAWVGGN